jgi:hypothetical protein
VVRAIQNRTCCVRYIVRAAWNVSRCGITSRCFPSCPTSCGEHQPFRGAPIERRRLADRYVYNLL